MNRKVKLLYSIVVVFFGAHVVAPNFLFYTHSHKDAEKPHVHAKDQIIFLTRKAYHTHHAHNRNEHHRHSHPHGGHKHLERASKSKSSDSPKAHAHLKQDYVFFSVPPFPTLFFNQVVVALPKFHPARPSNRISFSIRIRAPPSPFFSRDSLSYATLS